MKKLTTYPYYAALPLTFSIIAFIFIMLFQDMAYWGKDTMVWYNVGAGISYVSSLLATFFLVFLVIRIEHLHCRKVAFLFNNLIMICSGFLIFASLLWTTFIIIAWQSGL
ncbi:hypothetical protein [Heyndrickxia camelliae]|uniref:Uncharacterized protein n=1 Tax=Heyndrickxia camelliae TaxID=1707093 RepID=A0A2N3LHW3_9BACI|nr:hypothetical protein [Heyndrickxia camelliae]PKR84191.1 hypothetical protein CWO92_15415 [Heyndrickxia camelliae]